MTPKPVTFHPVCEAFPQMDEDALGELTADIRQNGLREAIWRHRGGAIIDGRNRFIACTRAGVAPKFRVYEGPDANLPAFVVSLNIQRRHLDTSQRAMVAAKLANLTNGQRAYPGKSAEVAVTQEQAAEMLNVSERAVRDARAVQEHAKPEVVQAVERGEMSVSAAARAARSASPRPANKSQAAVEQRRERMRELAGRGNTTEQIAAALGYADRSSAASALKRAGIRVPADQIVGKRRRLDSERIVGRIVEDADNLTAHVDLIDFAALSAERVPEWVASLKAAARALAAFIRKLEERR